METAIEAIKRVLDENLTRLRSFPNVLNVGIGHKWVNGVKTDQLCIKVYVSEKKPEAMLAPKDIIPKALLGIGIDVVELKGDGIRFEQTGPSLLPPESQRRIASGVKS